MQSLRILVVTNLYPPHHLGGYELSCRDVVERWSAFGHQVTVLTSDFRLADVAETPAESCDVRRELGFYWKNHTLTSSGIVRTYHVERNNQRVLAGALRTMEPDVVSFWHMGAMSLSLLTTVAQRRIPTVFVVCDDWLVYGLKVDPWMKFHSRHRRLGRVVSAFTATPARVQIDEGLAAFCFVSDWIRRRALERSAFAIRRNTVVYSGIDPTIFFPTNRGHGWSWRLLYAGRVEERKGVHVAIEAMRQLPAETTLEVIGRADPEYLDRLRVLCERLGVSDRVRFGSVKREALAERYRRSDALVFPVLWDEPFGLVPLEAMACATPVVGSAKGGTAEFLVDGGNAVVTEPGDAGALADGLRRLSEDTGLRERLRQNGLQSAAALTVDDLAQHLEEWHLAAARRFRNDVPPGRPSPRARFAFLETGGSA